MDVVVCKCSKCDAVLGRIINLWLQLGKKYMTPVAHVADDKDSFHIETSGAARTGEADSIVGGCQLQDAECAKCRANLGQKCLTSPPNHILGDGQVIFRIASLTLKSSTNQRRKAEPKMQRVLQLKVPTSTIPKDADAPPAQPPPPQPPPSATAPDNQDWPQTQAQLQAELEAQRQHINRVGAAGMQLVTSFEAAMARVDREMHQLTESIEGMRKVHDEQRSGLGALKTDLADVRWECQNGSGITARLDQQLQTTDRVVTELRQALQEASSETEELRKRLSIREEELQQAKGDAATLRAQTGEAKRIAHESIAQSREHAGELSSLRREMKQLRTEMAQMRAEPRGRAAAAETPSSFSSHELDILAGSISKIGTRASQVESLQMDFELFRTRLQRLEARANKDVSSAKNPGRSGAAAAATADEDDDDDDDDNHGNNVNHNNNDDELNLVYAGNIRRKRASTTRDDAQALGKTPRKRMAPSPSNLDSGVSTGYSRASDVYGSSPDMRPGRGGRNHRSGGGLSGVASEYGAAARRESWASGRG